MILGRIGWTVWALVPVALIAFHFGPGQRAWHADQAARIVAQAEDSQREALRLQDLAYAAHLQAIQARVAAFGHDTPDLVAAAKAAGAAEDAAYATAAAAWQETADTLGQAQALISEQDADLRNRVRLARARALVRSGDIGSGANDLEDLLEAMDTPAKRDSALAIAARTELATAYYYGARLMRLAGKPSADWREVAGRARQNYRYLAELARATGASAETVANHQKNGELVLDLEQSSLDELYAKARPKDSPTGNGRGLGPPRAGRGRRPGDKPSNGAGMNGEIGDGW